MDMVNTFRSQACDACRKRKVRCLPSAPHQYAQCQDLRCARCLQADLRCTYSYQRQKRGPKTGSVLKELRAFQASQERAESSFSRADNGMHYISTASTLPVCDSYSPPAASSTSGRMTSDGNMSSIAAPENTLESVKSRTTLFCLSMNQDFPGVQDTIDPVRYEMEHRGSITGETDPALRSPSLPLSPSLSLPLSPFDDVTLSKELIISEMTEFVACLYQRYPLWHPTIFIEQVGRGEHDNSIDFRLSCYAMILIGEAARFRQNPHRGRGRLMRLLEQIQSQRSSYFAQNPSCEAVTQSLAIFVAYSVCDVHKLAFYYLNEASGLLRQIDLTTLTPTVQALYWRIAAVLYITDLASSAVYGNPRAKGTMPYPQELADNESLMFWQIHDHKILSTCVSPLPQQRCYQALDNKAVSMLHTLVLLYGAESTDQILEVCVPRTTILAIIESTMPNSDTSMQEVDVNLTKQWLLGQHWEKKFAASSAVQRKKHQRNAQAAYLLQSIGLSSLQHIRALDPGQQRIVGHGKLANLSTSIFNIASTLDVLAQCTDIISQLIRAVHDLDYESLFTPGLSMIEMMITGIPQQLSLPFNEEGEAHQEAAGGSTWADSMDQETAVES